VRFVTSFTLVVRHELKVAKKISEVRHLRFIETSTAAAAYRFRLMPRMVCEPEAQACALEKPT
jgi:hypothetical protein